MISHINCASARRFSSENEKLRAKLIWKELVEPYIVNSILEQKYCCTVQFIQGKGWDLEMENLANDLKFHISKTWELAILYVTISWEHIPPNV